MADRRIDPARMGPILKERIGKELIKADYDFDGLGVKLNCYRPSRLLVMSQRDFDGLSWDIIVDLRGRHGLPPRRTTLTVNTFNDGEFNIIGVLLLQPLCEALNSMLGGENGREWIGCTEEVTT
jgi:hypothetical protein